MIAIDTNVFIYHLASDEKFGPAAKELLERVETGREAAVCSAVTYAEILTLPARQKKTELVARYRELLRHFPNLKFVPVDEETAHEAALLRGAHPALKLMDAMILATALRSGAKALVTEDRHLKVPRFGVPVRTLSEYLGG